MNHLSINSDNNLIDDIPKRYLIQVKRGISWSYRELELTNDMISYYKQENNELRFQGFIKDFELIQHKKNLLTLTPKNKQNNIEVKIWSEDSKQLVRIKQTFDYLLSKLNKNTNEGKKNIILDSSEDSRESIQEGLGSLLDNSELIGGSRQRTNSSIFETKSSLILNDSSNAKQMQIDLTGDLKQHRDNENDDEEDEENDDGNNNNRIINNDNKDKVKSKQTREIENKVSNKFHNKEFKQNNLQKYFDLTIEKSEQYNNICYTKHSIIDINTESNDDIMTFHIIMNDSFIDSINMLKTEAVELSKGKDCFFNGTHIILLLSLVVVTLSLSFFIQSQLILYLLAFGIGGLAYSFIYGKWLNQPKLPSLIIKDPQFDHNFIENDKRIIRVSSFFNEKLHDLMKKLANDDTIIDSSYTYLINRKDDGTMIYRSNLFDLYDYCEIKLTKESNWKEEDCKKMKEIIINEYINNDILRTISFEEKEIEDNIYMTKATVYLRISALYNNNIPVTFVKDTLSSFDNIHRLLLKADFN